MFVIYKRSLSLIVLYAVMLHLTWAADIAWDDAAVNATAVNALFRYIHPPLLLVGVLVTVAALALFGIMTQMPWVALLLAPQQLILMASASGAMEAIWLAQFADGVIRPRAFLLADQINSVWAAVMHTAAIVAHAKRLTG